MNRPDTRHVTSVSAVGPVLELLRALPIRDRGCWISHLVEHQPKPTMDDASREGAEVLRLRLSDLAAAELAKAGAGRQARLVDAYVRAGWSRLLTIVRDLVAHGIALPEVGILAHVCESVAPTTPAAVVAAARFATVEPAWALPAHVVAALEPCAHRLVELRQLVPDDTHALIDLALETVRDEQRPKRKGKVA